jgi:CheY-like chemotaxis protein
MNNFVIRNEQVFVSLDVVWQGRAGKFDSLMSEVSITGCFIESIGQEIFGETIIFNTQLSSGIWVTFHGEVVNKEYLTGFELRFINLTQEKRRLLIQIVAAHGGNLAQQILKEEEKTFASQVFDNSRRVLVADDDPMTLELVSAIVEAQDYDVISVPDGREAFKILEQDADFSAAIFDMTMPHLDGLGLIRYAKTAHRLRHIPIGMITAEQDPKIWDDSVIAGVSVFLPKPLTPPQIQMMLRMLTNKGGLQNNFLTLH